MVTAMLSERDRLIADMRKFGENADWAQAHRAECREYVDQFVAVDDGRIVGTADDPHELYGRFADRRWVYITWVAPEGLLWVL